MADDAERSDTRRDSTDVEADREQAGPLGPLTDEDWSAARRALGRGSRSILFGTSDKVIDAAVRRLSKAGRSRRHPAPGVA